MRSPWPSNIKAVWHPGSLAGVMLVAVIVGAVVGFGAFLLVESIRLVADGVQWLGEAMPTDWLWMFISVPAGITAAWWLARRFAPEAAGDGVPQVAASLIVSGGFVRRRLAPIKLAVTTLTLGAAGSGGREGPIAQIGSAVGSVAARWAGVGEAHARSLVAAGAAAGIGASFNAPIAGMLFAMEVVLGGFSIRHLNTVVVASVSAAVVSRSLVGPDLTFPRVQYELGDARELLAYAAVGLLAVVAAVVFLRAVGLAERFSHGVRTHQWRVPLAYGLLVASLGLASIWLRESSDPLAPDVLGTGQDFITFLLRSGSVAWWVLAIIAGLKIAATAATMGSGASAGAFAPSLFIGAAIGSGFASLIEPIWTFSDLQRGAFAIVGMSATFAAVARAPLTSILIVFEVTQDYGLTLPLMLATTLATLLAERIHPESVYSMALARMGIGRWMDSEIDLLDTVRVADVVQEDPPVASPDMPLDEVQAQVDANRLHGLPVVDDGNLVGIITVTDIGRAGGPMPELTAGEAMTPGPTTVTPDSPVSVALERMALLGVGRLPVVSSSDPKRLVGMFRREDAVHAYHHARRSQSDAEMSRQRLRVRPRGEANFFSFTLTASSPADGQLVRDVAWPTGCTLVSVQRGREVLVPSGDTKLKTDDVVTAFGSADAERRLRARLRGPLLSEDDIGS